MTRNLTANRVRRKTVKRQVHIILWLPCGPHRHPLSDAIVDVVADWGWAITRGSDDQYHAFGEASGVFGRA